MCVSLFAVSVLCGVCVPVFAVVVRNSLGIFHCVKGSNGSPVLSIEPSVVCYEPGGVHEMLLPWAIVGTVLYAVGIPLAFGYLLFHYRAQVRADQELKIRGEGSIPESNPNINVRKRFRKLYEDYKPHMFAWKMALLFRKLLIVAISILLGKNAVLQGALSIAVLFTAYYLQQRHQPFAPVSPIPTVLLSNLVPPGSVDVDGAAVCDVPSIPASDRLSKALRKAEVSALMKLTSQRWAMWKVDYNSMESSFIVCSNLILMAGIMFTSSAFPVGSVGYDAMSVVVSILIVSCMALFVCLLVFEVYRSVRLIKLNSLARKLEAAVYGVQTSPGRGWAQVNPLASLSVISRTVKTSELKPAVASKTPAPLSSLPVVVPWSG